MAKIDTSKIVGFDEMSAEDKVKALTEYEIETPDNGAEIARYKELISKANSEASKYRKLMNERPSNDDLATLKSEVETLRRDKTIADYTAQFIALGYTKELATDTAQRMADGDINAVFASQKVVNEAMQAELAKQKALSQPTPASGTPIPDFEAEKAEKNRLRKLAGLPLL